MINSLSIDLLIRIKNAYKAGKKEISTPLSKFCQNICEILKKHQYITSYSVDKDNRLLIINLKYTNQCPAVNDVKIFSKPGRRYYSKTSTIPWGKVNNSLIIISTSSGLLSQREAVKKNFGGELIAEIY